eukprot:TRINITY_DN6821_c0_g1_i2.p1 TRINITY_DN6821_c0_g1~~TRINITY_DN6821_c0_g1_i2.p1  ORF type:complete len:559 (-),score=146.54 TRINITY_DN6821_c0_g1_i2:58-1689(-)
MTLEIEQYVTSLQNLRLHHQWRSIRMVGEVGVTKCLGKPSIPLGKAMCYYAESLEKIGENYAAAKAAEEAILIMSSLDAAGCGAELAIARHTIAKCSANANDTRAAALALGQIPIADRTVEMLMDLGSLHRLLNNSAEAILCYSQALAKCPVLIEANLALAELGAPASTVSNHCASAPPVTRDWVTVACAVATATRSMDVDAAVMRSRDLAAIAPGSSFVHIFCGKALAQAGETSAATASFERARAAQPFTTLGFDSAAFAMSAGDVRRMSQLVQQGLKNSPLRPEGFIASGWYAMAMSKADKALSFAERASNMAGPLNAFSQVSVVVEAEMLRGAAALVLNRPGLAATAYRIVHGLQPSLMAHKGLCMAYVLAGRHRDALSVAQLALKAAPKSPIALSILGKALVSSGGADNLTRAKKALQAAMTRPECPDDAPIMLADLSIAEGKATDAVAVLKAAIQKRPTLEMHLKLAQALAGLGDHDNALAQYHQALVLHPTSEQAQAGLDSLQKLMRGEPDGAETADDEDEDEDDEEDQDDEEMVDA